MKRIPCLKNSVEFELKIQMVKGNRIKTRCCHVVEQIMPVLNVCGSVCRKCYSFNIHEQIVARKEAHAMWRKTGRFGVLIVGRVANGDSHGL